MIIFHWTYFLVEEIYNILMRKKKRVDIGWDTSNDVTEILGLLQIHAPGPGGSLAQYLLSWLCLLSHLFSANSFLKILVGHYCWQANYSLF